MVSLSSCLRILAYNIKDFATFKPDGSVVVKVDAVPEEVWAKYSIAMRHLGYDYNGAKDAEELTRRSLKGKDTVVLTDDHAKAFASAVGKKDLFKPKSNKAVIQKAIKMFGITNSYEHAGYILNDDRKSVV